MTSGRRPAFKLLKGLKIVPAVAGGYLAFAIVMAWALRLKPIRVRFTRLMRRTFNPMIRRLVVERLGLLGSIAHRGRRTGRHYMTPVLAVPFDDGFVVPLTYGTQVDWYRNVVSAQKCQLVWRKQEYRLVRPETIRLSQTGGAYPWPLRWTFLAGGVNHHALLHQRPG